MSELGRPIAGLRQIIGTLEAISASSGRRESKIEAAICQIQFAIDLLDDAHSIET